MQQAGAALLVPQMARQDSDRGVALAQVMAQAGQPHRQRGLQARAHVHHHHHMNAGIHLGVVVGTLRHTPQAVHFRQQPGQRAAVAQHRKHARGFGFHQAARQLLPDAFGHQVIHLARSHHLAHELQSFRGQREVGKARRQARQPQNTHRVFTKRRADMAKHLVDQILRTAIRVDRILLVPYAVRAELRSSNGHGIDGEIAPCQVFFQTHIRRRMDGKTVVARRSFSFSAGQCVFIVGLRMQEHRKVFAHRHKTLIQHVLRRAPHHHPVAILYRQPHQCITHRTANHIELHVSARHLSATSGKALQNPGNPARPARHRSTP